MATTSKKTRRNHIHHDMSFSILSKLSLKSLKRFTCVCKSWALLFENSNFMTLFLNNISSNQDDEVCLFLKHLSSSRDRHYSFNLLSGDRFQSKVKLDLLSIFPDNYYKVYILGSGISGLICLFSVDHICVVLWNPATHEFKVVPSDLVQPPPDSSTSPILHGFGYDHVQDDYKIIRSLDFIPKHSHRLLYKSKTSPLWQIYSLQKNTWKNLDVSIPIRRWRRCDVGGEVYLNGVCHWLGTIEDDEPCVVSFNLAQEVFFPTIFPSQYMNDLALKNIFCVLESVYLMVLYESVAIIISDHKTSSFHVYILNEIGIQNSWTKLFIIGPLPCLHFPIGTGKNGDIFFNKYDDTIAYIDLNIQQVEDIGVAGGLFSTHLGIYRKSLLAVGRLNN